MTQILVRDLELSSVSSLKMFAKKHNRSRQPEVKRILEQAAAKAAYYPAKMAAEIRNKCKNAQTSDSVELLHINS